MNCRNCEFCYDDEDSLYCSKYSEYVNTYSNCELIKKGRIENE